MHALVDGDEDEARAEEVEVSRPARHRVEGLLRMPPQRRDGEVEAAEEGVHLLAPHRRHQTRVLQQPMQQHVDQVVVKVLGLC